MRLVARGAAAWVRRFHALSALLAYAFITLYLTYPLVLQIGSAVASDAGDPLLNTWILSWNARTLPFTTDWWNAPMFYPAEGVLAFSENLLGLSILSTPVIWLTNNPLLAYNLVFLLSFPLSGAAAYLLAFELTRRRDAAWVAGLLFAFCPYRMGQMPHLQVLVSFWMPLALFGLHVYLRDGRARWLVLFGSALLFQGLSNLYFLLFISGSGGDVVVVVHADGRPLADARVRRHRLGSGLAPAGPTAPDIPGRPRPVRFRTVSGRNLRVQR